MKLFGPTNSGSAAGVAGSATANTNSTIILTGRVLAIYIRYNDSPPAGTTDVIIATAGTNAPANTLLTLTDAATDGWFYVRHKVHDETGAGITYDGTNEVYEAPPICDYVNVKIQGANASDSIDAWFLMSDC